MAPSEHRSTTRVLDILELLSRNRDGYTLAELARLLDAPKSSLFPIVHTMEERRFLLLNPQTGQYRIGQSTYFVGSAYESSSPSYDFVRDRMKQLADACHETCHLGVRSGGNVLYIAKTEVPSAIMLRSHVGQTLPAYCTGVGKALLCDCSADELRALYPDGLAAYTAATITDPDTLIAELARVRETGFAYEHSELTEGILCIAVPLRCRGAVIAAVSVCLPAYRASDSLEEQIRSLLEELRADVERHFAEFNVTDSAMLM